MVTAVGLGGLGALVVAAAAPIPVQEARPSLAAALEPLPLRPLPVVATPVLLPAEPATVATAVVPSLPIYSRPTTVSPVISQLANPSELGAPLVLLAVAKEGSWLQTYLPQRPNESTGWVPLADVSLTQDPYRITISLGARQLTLFNGDTPVFATSVAPGEPSSPTPTGYFFVSEILKLTDPGTAYGPYALGTSAFSNSYYSFDGGPGQVAIHGTNQPWLIGGYASHGCVRLDNAAITTLAQQVPPGTPVAISL